MGVLNLHFQAESILRTQLNALRSRRLEVVCLDPKKQLIVSQERLDQ